MGCDTARDNAPLRAILDARLSFILVDSTIVMLFIRRRKIASLYVTMTLAVSMAVSMMVVVMVVMTMGACSRRCLRRTGSVVHRSVGDWVANG